MQYALSSIFVGQKNECLIFFTEFQNKKLSSFNGDKDAMQEFVSYRDFFGKYAFNFQYLGSLYLKIPKWKGKSTKMCQKNNSSACIIFENTLLQELGQVKK